MTLRLVYALVAGVAAAACGGARSAGDGAAGGVSLAANEPVAVQSRCAPTDTVLRLDAGVYRACDVDRPARPRGRMEVPSRWEPGTGARKDCYTALVGFVVDPQGVPLSHTVTVLRSNDPSFARALVDAVPSWRYTPAMRGGAPVSQWVEYDGKVAVMTRVVSSRGTSVASRPSVC